MRARKPRVGVEPNRRFIAGEDVQHQRRTTFYLRLPLNLLHQEFRNPSAAQGWIHIQRDDVAGAAFFGLLHVQDDEAHESVALFGDDHVRFLCFGKPAHCRA